MLLFIETFLGIYYDHVIITYNIRHVNYCLFVFKGLNQSRFIDN